MTMVTVICRLDGDDDNKYFGEPFNVTLALNDFLEQWYRPTINSLSPNSGRKRMRPRG